MANPALPKKTQLRRALVELLKTVRTDGGYWTEMGLNVSQDRKPIQMHRASELPRAVVVWGSEERIDGCLGGMGRAKCPFVVYVVVGGAREKIQDLVDAAEQDVKRAAWSGSLFGGLASKVTWIASESDHQLLAAEDPGAQVRAQVAVTFEVEYDLTASAP